MFALFIVILIMFCANYAFFGSTTNIGKVISNPKFLPLRKPQYLGPFGSNYKYLLNKKDRTSFSKAIVAAKLKRWSKARKLVENIKPSVVKNFITWLYLKDINSKADFRFRAIFIRKHHNWPEMKLIRSRAEKFANDGSMLSSERINWFAMFPPLTGSGLESLANAHKDKNELDQSTKLAKQAWHLHNFTAYEEKRFLKSFGYLFNKKDHEIRLENLIWDRKFSASRRMFKRVNRSYRRLAEARIALKTSSYGVDAKIARVPNNLRQHSSLTFDRIKWRRKRGKYLSAKKLILENTNDSIRPTLWWKERYILSRHSISRNRMEEAYAITSSHKAKDNLSIFEAEWQSGWLLNSFIGDYDKSLQHFYNVYDAVSFPVSLSKAAYWIGRTLEKANKKEIAIPWYEKASMYSTTFYGQLASEKIYNKKINSLPSDINPNKDQINAFNQIDLVQILRILAESEQNKYLKRFALSISSSGQPVNSFLVAKMINTFGRPDLGVWIARKASQKKINLITHGYPIPTYDYPTFPEKALILAVIRQESNFDISAKSHAGARGLMQLMPATARVMSRSINQRYDRDALTIDPSYNIKLGSNYLSQLLKDFNGSYAMTLAGYNAGPHRVKRWVRNYGDPRKNKSEIDWIEQIPFRETRNYVKRVLENLNVYREIIKNTEKTKL